MEPRLIVRHTTQRGGRVLSRHQSWVVVVEGVLDRLAVGRTRHSPEWDGRWRVAVGNSGRCLLGLVEESY